MDKVKKKCPKCNKIKEACRPIKKSDFYSSRQTKDGFDGWCKTCRVSYQTSDGNKKIKRRIDEERRKTKKHKIRMRTWTFKKKYDLTLAEHESIYISQNGKCAICKQVVAYDKIHTDHDHKTGKVRGLLCGRCNLFLAGFDDEDFYSAAIKYLEGGD